MKITIDIPESDYNDLKNHWKTIVDENELTDYTFDKYLQDTISEEADYARTGVHPSHDLQVREQIIGAVRELTEG